MAQPSKPDDRLLVRVLEANLKGKLCDSCHNEAPLQRCSACKRFYYCSKKCQKADWNEAHKYGECSLYKLDAENQLNQQEDSTLRLLARVYLVTRHSRRKWPNKDLSVDYNGARQSFILSHLAGCSQHAPNLQSLIDNVFKSKVSSLARTVWEYEMILKQILASKLDWDQYDQMVLLASIERKAFKVFKQGTQFIAMAHYVDTELFDHLGYQPDSITPDRDRATTSAGVARPGNNQSVSGQYVEVIAGPETQELSFQAIEDFRKGYELLALLKYAKTVGRQRRSEWVEEVERLHLMMLRIRFKLRNAVNDEALGIPPYEEILSRWTDKVHLRSPQVRDWFEEARDCWKRFDATEAEEDFHLGDIIKKNLPCFYAVLTQFKGSLCDYCLKSLDGLTESFKCDKCNSAFYCSINCRRLDAKSHCVKNTLCILELCGSASRMDTIIYVYTRHYTNLLNSLLKSDDTASDTPTTRPPQDAPRVFYNDANVRPSKFGDPRQTISDAMKVYGEPQERVLYDTFTQCLPGLVNIHQGSGRRERIALGSIPQATLARLSLEPNSELILDQGTVSWRAKKDIPRGTKITLGYY